ncbi:MAG TPA: glycosyltransferase family 4 protein [Panacibacter sp.]|nr:glycosyltransferase family 4 protein [Panacibacter sp.]
MLFYLIITVLFFGIMYAYFKIARHYNITDRPNERSSHSSVTIRGGGIIFLIAALVIAGLYYSQFAGIIFSILIIGIISFLDDIYTLPRSFRLTFHFIAVTILVIYFNIFPAYPLYAILLFYVLVTGIINAYNFMDGINGITGLYSLIIFASLQYINIKQLAFIPADVIWVPMLACVVFLFFNFRKKAVCFAGDVGSVTLALWVVFILLSLSLKTHNWNYVLFLSVYGTDSVLTILHRFLRSENIFKPHRLHLYQLLANEQKIPHLMVTCIYCFIQVAINILIISTHLSFPVSFLLICIPLGLIYIVVKPRMMTAKKNSVLNKGSI